MGGNSPKEAKAEVSWDYAQDAILVEIVSDPELNFYSNQAHTAVLGIFQVSDQKVFVDLLAKRAEMVKTLISGKTGSDVLKLDRFVVNSGKKTTLKLNRVQNAKFVGFVVGYYQFNALTSTRLFRIPLNMDSSGIISKSYKAEPAVLAIRLFLGSEQIVNAQSLTFDADKKAVVETLPLDTSNPEIKLTAEQIDLAKSSGQAARRLTD